MKLNWKDKQTEPFKDKLRREILITVEVAVGPFLPPFTDEDAWLQKCQDKGDHAVRATGRVKDADGTWSTTEYFLVGARAQRVHQVVALRQYALTEARRIANSANWKPGDQFYD